MTSRGLRRGWLAGVVVLCTAAGVAGRTVTVSQIGRAFTGGPLQLQRGDTVRFTNDDAFDHQVFVDSATFKVETAAQPPGGAGDIKFPVAGVFDVRCAIHPRMHLAVSVD